jgi:hypothetical protein
MALGLATSLNTVRKTELVRAVTSGLVLKSNFDTGAVTPISDGSASFDGSTHYVALASETSISGDWSVSSWVKPTVVNFRAIIASSASSQTLVGFAGTDDILVRLEKASGTSYWYSNWDPGFADWSTTEWFHLVVTKTGTTLTPYLNGVAGTTGTLNGSDGVLKADAIGGMTADTTLSYKFTGNICNLGIWSGALTQPQIKSIMYKNYAGLSDSDKDAGTTGTPNLVSWWNLSADANDNQGSNNGTLSGS